MTDQYEDIEIPFHMVGNNQVLYCWQLEDPNIRAFRDQFDNCFEYCPGAQYHVFYPEGKPQ